MKTIDEARLETDLTYRYEYLADFIGFGPADVALIQGSAPYLGPLLPELVEATYARLLAFDATARHFLPRNAGFEGTVPGDLAALVATHPQIQFRKEHLSRYFHQLLGRSYDAKMVLYLDMVGKIHTPAAGNHEISIPLVQMNALMGVLADALVDLLSRSLPEAGSLLPTIRAFQKLLWIQNDFINRHYAVRSTAVE